MYTIYSVGDVQYLARVFDGVSMLTGSGSLVGASAIACLIGVIFLCFQSVINTQGIKIQNVLVCFVIYLVCFAVPTQVNIVSSNDDSNFAQRDNVPLGIAMIGSTISTITHELTEKMEIAMTPVLTDSTVIASKNGGGYANSLYLLNHVTRPQTGYAVQLVDSKNPGFINNLNSYAAECTVIKYILGGKNTPKDFSQLATKNFIDAVTFDSEVYFTSLTDPQTGSIEDYSCREGMAKIKSWWNDSLKNLTEAESASLAKELLGASSNSGDFTSYNEIVNRISAKTAEMAGMGYAAADRGLPQLSTAMVQELIFANATRDVVMRGVAQGYTSFSDTNSSYMLTQAMLQRNSQWAAESSMFLNSVPAIMAFIEGFFYAITPFASILILLGLFGLNIFIKYIILLLWVQLWTPVMAIINMYIMHGAALDIFKIPAQLTGQDSSVSLYMNDSIAQVTENWISVGSMFMAATPLLTFIILTGSAYALTSLTSRMNGADVINEKMNTPDLIQPGAGLAMSSVFNGNTLAAVRSGMENLMQKFSLGGSIKSTLSYAQSNAKNDLDNFVNNFSKNIGTVVAKGGSALTQFVNNQATMGSKTQLGSLTDAYTDSLVNSIARGRNMSIEDTNSLKAALNTGFSIGAGGFSVGGSLEAAKTILSNYGISENKAQQIMNQASNAFNTSHAAQIAEAVTDSLQDAKSANISLGDAGQIVDGFVKSKNTAITSAKQAQEMAAIDVSASTVGNYSPVEMVGNMMRTAQGRQDLEKIDQLYDQLYNSVTDQQRVLLDANMNNCSGLTADASVNERVAKVYSLMTADTGKVGDLSDDIGRRTDTMKTLLQSQPGGATIAGSLDSINSQTTLTAALGASALQSASGFDQQQANEVGNRVKNLVKEGKDRTSSDPEVVKQNVNPKTNPSVQFGQSGLLDLEIENLERLQKKTSFQILSGQADEDKNPVAKSFYKSAGDGASFTKYFTEEAKIPKNTEWSKCLSEEPTEYLVNGTLNVDGIFRQQGDNPQASPLFKDFKSNLLLEQGAIANYKERFDSANDKVDRDGSVVQRASNTVNSWSTFDNSRLDSKEKDANDLIGLGGEKDAENSYGSFLRGIYLGELEDINNFVKAEKLNSELISESETIRQYNTKAYLSSDKNIEKAKIENQKFSKKYEEYQNIIKGLSSKYSNYESHVNNRIEKAKKYLTDRYYISEDQAQKIASLTVNSIVNLTQIDKNDSSLYNNILDSLRQNVASLEGLQKKKKK